MKKKTLAEAFCERANQFLEDYRSCGGKITPHEMLNKDFWYQLAGPGQGKARRWHVRTTNPEAWSRRKRSLVQQAGIIRRILIVEADKVVTGLVVFSDNSRARAVRIPVILRKGEWWWGCDV